LAPKTFFIETRFGCARVVDQWADGRDAVDDAVAACPVSCIHWVDRTRELPLLERAGLPHHPPHARSAPVLTTSFTAIAMPRFFS
jgi:hypothetical protein